MPKHKQWLGKKQAENRGFVTYMGRRCKRGHSGLRQISDGRCVQCEISESFTPNANRARRNLRSLAKALVVIWDECGGASEATGEMIETIRNELARTAVAARVLGGG